MQWKVIIILFISYVIYLLIGAASFQALERPSESEQCQDIQDQVSDISSRLQSPNVTKEDAIALLKVVQLATANGIDISENLTVTCVVKWDLEGSFFFCGTVLTTIGYGHISPTTYFGKVVCILYAIIGIPIFAILFSGLGGKVGKRVSKLEKRIGNKRSWVNKLAVAFIILIPFIVFFLIIPAIIFVRVEGWTYNDSFYYAFISLTTIGFGDYVAGVNPEIDYFRIYRTMVYFWILFGLAVAATVVGAFTELWMEATSKRRTTQEKENDEVLPENAAKQEIDSGQNENAAFETEYDF